MAKTLLTRVGVEGRLIRKEVDKMKELVQALINQGIITSTDIQRMTTLELLLTIIERVNELHGLTKEGLEAVQRLLDKGVQEEVVAQLDEWLHDGTFDTLINQTALKEVNDRVDETNAQLSDLITQITVSIEKYKHLVRDDDWSTAFSEALNELPQGGKLLLKGGKTYLITSAIEIDSFQCIEGENRSATLKLKDNTISDVITLKSETSRAVEIRNLTVDGNSVNGCVGNGIDLSNTFSMMEFTGDSRNVIENVLILNCSKNGLIVKGRGESYCDKIQVLNVGLDGLYLDCWDNWFSNISVARCQRNGINVLRTNNRFSNCKAWYSLTGYRIEGSKNVLTNCEVQDCSNGFNVLGDVNELFSIFCDSVGYNVFTYAPRAGAESIYIKGNMNVIDGVCVDRKELDTNGTTDYVLSIDGDHNRINIVARDVKVRNIKTNIIDIKDGNKIHVKATLSNGFTSNTDFENELKFINKTNNGVNILPTSSYLDIAFNNNGVVDYNNDVRYDFSSKTLISKSKFTTEKDTRVANSFIIGIGSDAQGNYSFITPLIDGEEQWNNGLRFHHTTKKWTVNGEEIS